MATLRDTVGLACSKLHDRPHLLRLRYLIFLMDWTSAVIQGRQITSLGWVSSSLGPDSEALTSFLQRSREFSVRGPGGSAAMVSFAGPPDFPTLTAPDRRIIEEIVRVTEDMDWVHVQRLVYQSDPMRFSARNQALNLERFAKTRSPFATRGAAQAPAQARLAASGGTV